MAAKPTKEEILQSIKRAYLLLESLDGELAWLRDFVKPDVKKILNEAKSKNNHLKVTIVRGMSDQGRAQVEEMAVEFHEKIIETLGLPSALESNIILFPCSKCGVESNCMFYENIRLCHKCNPF